MVTERTDFRPSTFFREGMPAEIELAPEDRLATRIEEIRNETLVLAMPMKGTALRALPIGLPVQLVCPKRSNQYFFKTKIVGNQFEPEPITIVERPPDNAGMQLRDYARVDVIINEVQVWVEEEGRYSETKKAVILDISAGGARLQMTERIEAGAKVTLKFRLPPIDKGWPTARTRFGAPKKKSPYRRKVEENPSATDEVTLDADVVRCVAADIEQGRRYRLGIKWVNTGKLNQDRIIRLVFQRELELRRRGAL